MVTLTVDGHCPVCQGPAQIEVQQIDQCTSTFTCIKHPQFSHRLTLPTAVPLAYTVVRFDDAAAAVTTGATFGTPQEAAGWCDALQFLRDNDVTPSGRRFAVAAVTLIADPA